MAAPNLKVLIAGGGVAGHSFAYWLTRTHLNVAITIVERAPEPRTSGQAIDIRGPAIEVIRRMNLEDTIRSRHTTEIGLTIIDATGKVVGQFDASGDSNKQANATSEFEILRADLTQLLLEAIDGDSNIKYIYGDAIQSMTQTEQTVNVTLRSGSSETYDLVVAADGATSKTRSLFLPEDILQDCYKFIGQYIAFFSIPSQKEDNKFWKWYNTSRGRMAAIRPHRNPATMGAYLCITTPAKTTKDPKVEEALDTGIDQQKALLHEYFEDAGWQSKRILDGMDIAEDFYMNRCALVKLPKWSNGRALVLGDAAHATFGVGTSFAIEGAYVLAGELSKIKSASDVPEALRKYEAEFRPWVDDQQSFPPGFPQMMNPQTGWGLSIMRSIIWTVSKTKVYKLIGMGGEIKPSKWKLPDYDWKKIQKGEVGSVPAPLNKA
jgi:2-polyprenyl-6-methoxyphenol hydroxylase-like FAD-dependent oxidoreductase